MLSLWQNNFIFEKSTYFSVIPDNSRFIFYMLQIMPTRPIE